MPSQMILILGGVGGIAIIGVIAFLVLRNRGGSDADDRLGRYDQGDQYLSFLEEDNVVEEKPKEPLTARRIIRGILAPANALLGERNFAKGWKRQLSRADIKLTVAEYAMAHVVSMAGFFAVAYFVIFRGDLVFSIIAGVIGLFAPRIYVSRRVSKRLHNFEDQLADTLGLWVNALKSGYSVLQAMGAIANDAPEPTKTEFKRVVQEAQLGIDLPDAFDHMLERVASEDLDLVITAVNIQREVGGNLSEILSVISTTIRERVKLKGEIRVLTSQGRITGYLISFLPIGLSFLLNAINPGYMGQMFSNRTCGWPMVAGALILIGIGTAIVQKIVDIEI